jgi:hypothetical protein
MHAPPRRRAAATHLHTQRRLSSAARCPPAGAARPPPGEGASGWAGLAGPRPAAAPLSRRSTQSSPIPHLTPLTPSPRPLPSPPAPAAIRACHGDGRPRGSKAPIGSRPRAGEGQRPWAAGGCERGRGRGGSGGGVDGDEEAVGLVALVDQVEVHVDHDLPPKHHPRQTPPPPSLSSPSPPARLGSGGPAGNGRVTACVQAAGQRGPRPFCLQQHSAKTGRGRRRGESADSDERRWAPLELRPSRLRRRAHVALPVAAAAGGGGVRVRVGARGACWESLRIRWQ